MLKTKVRTMNNTFPYSGSSEQKGMHGETVTSFLSFEGDSEDMIILGKGIKCGEKLEEMRRQFKIVDGKMHLLQTVGNVTAKRILVKQ